MEKLLFVYNAKSGKTNLALDIAHKILSPKTYNCNLCALTHHTFTENKVWKAFKNDCKFVFEFYHKDEFETKYPNLNLSYPIILIENKSKLSILLDSNTIEDFTEINQLILALKEKTFGLARVRD